MTLQQAVDIVKRLAHKGDINVTNDEDTSVVLQGINLARRDILLELPKHYLRNTSSFNTTTGSNTYTLASDVQKPVLFRYTSSNTEYILKKIETETEFYHLLYVANSTQRRPEWYFEAGIDTSGSTPAFQIAIWPTPNIAYTINYIYYKTWTTDILTTSNLTANIPEIPIHLHNQVCVGAVFYVLAAFDDPKTEVWEARYERAKLRANAYEEADEDSLLAFRLRPHKIESGY